MDDRPENTTELARGGLRRAMSLITLAGVFWAVWQAATSGTSFTLYAQSLGASKFQFGLLTAIPFITSLMTLPGSWVIELTGRRKPFFFGGMYIHRCVWFPLALIPLWMISRYGTDQRPVALLVFIGLYALLNAGQAFGAPAWVSWMSDVVPERIRGHYFSRRRQLGMLTAIPAALIVGWLLDRHGGGASDIDTMRLCAQIFMIAAVFGMLDIAMFHAVPDIPKPPRQGGHLLRAMRGPLHDRQFVWMAIFIGVLMFTINFMGQQFLMLFMIEKLGSKNIGTQLMLLSVPMLAQLVVLPAWGRATDRMGKKPVLALASLGLVPVGFAWCMVGPGTIWLGYILAALGAALWAGVEVANLNLVMEMSGTSDSDGERGSSYYAVNNVIVNVGGCLGGLAAGLVAQSLNDWSWQPMTSFRPFTFYEVLFAVSGLLRLAAAVIFLPHIHEHAARPTGEALRFISANIYGGLYSVVQIPLKFVRKTG